MDNNKEPDTPSDKPHEKWSSKCEHRQTRKECFRCIVEKEASFRDLYNLFDRTDDGKD